jgi:nucleotide-binding universal stress UspA family protein
MSTRLESAVVSGVDGSALAGRALVWAAQEADRWRAPLRVVHAVDLGRYNSGGLALSQDFFDALLAGGRDLLRQATDEVRQRFPDVPVTEHLYQIGARAALLAESAHARQVVLGARGSGGTIGMLAGSTAFSLAAHGRCPVVVVRGRQPDDAAPTGGPVVVGVDGSPAGEEAIACAFDEASIRGVGLVAVHTWLELAADSAYAHARRFRARFDAVDVHEQEILAQRLAGWSEKYPDVPVRRVVLRDRPVRCLLEQAADAQLLVVGSRGRVGSAGLLLGSTSQPLLHHATCPVMVVRPQGD